MQMWKYNKIYPIYERENNNRSRSKNKIRWFINFDLFVSDDSQGVRNIFSKR